MSVLRTIITTLLVWLAHAGLITAYIGLFRDTSSLFFRLAHAAEVSIVTATGFYIATRYFGQQPSVLFQILTVLLVLIVVDLIVFKAFKDLQKQFDLFHFVAVYMCVAIVVAIVAKVSR